MGGPMWPADPQTCKLIARCLANPAHTSESIWPTWSQRDILGRSRPDPMCSTVRLVSSCGLNERNQLGSRWIE